jgi:prevent-host-death family protein
MVMFMVTKPKSPSKRRPRRTTKRPPRPARRPPETITAAEFKAKCLELMDAVAETWTEITITKRGRPVAVLSPARARRRGPSFGFAKDLIREVGDVISPIDVVWDAER